jgi:hypothetical protein
MRTSQEGNVRPRSHTDIDPLLWRDHILVRRWGWDWLTARLRRLNLPLVRGSPSRLVARLVLRHVVRPWGHTRLTGGGWRYIRAVKRRLDVRAVRLA